MSGCPLPSRSRPMEWIVHFEPGSVSFGFDCQTGLPCRRTTTRSSAAFGSATPFTRATTASNSWNGFTSAPSSPWAASQALASCAAAGIAAARQSRKGMNLMLRLRSWTADKLPLRAALRLQKAFFEMRFISLALACLCLSLAARATTPTTDFSDLWYNANEEGWGVTITQQNDILFVTLFVYGPNNQPKWYVGPATFFLGSSVTGAVTFSGPLYEATGPYFGAPVFNEAAVAPTPVGTVSFTAGQISTGTLSYTVNGVTVTKTITRQTWRVENLSGVYVGASLGINAGCGALDGYFEVPASFTIVHDGAA